MQFIGNQMETVFSECNKLKKKNLSKIWKRNTRFLILLSEFHAK